jgi:hypothetical protein
VVDYCLVNYEMLRCVKKFYVSNDSLLSDHFPIVVELEFMCGVNDVCEPVQDERYVIYPRIERMNEWYDVLESNNQDVIIQSFDELFIGDLKSTKKKKENALSSRLYILHDEKLDDMIMRKNKMHQELYHFSSKEEWDNYFLFIKRIHKYAQKLRKDVQTKLLKDNIMKLKETKDVEPYKCWQLLNSITQSGKKQVGHVIIKNLDEKDAMIQSFSSFFQSLFAYSVGSYNFKNDCAVVFNMNNDNLLNMNAWYDKDLEIKEVQIAIHKLKKRKAAGLDNIKSDFIKHGDDDFVELLYTYLCYLFYNQLVPDSFKVGKIILLYKGKGDEKDPNNYRCIQLLNQFGKVFVSIINSRIYNHLEQNNLLVDEQCGFRRNRGTMDQIFILNEVIR